MTESIIRSELTRELELLKSDTVKQQAESKYLSRFIRSIKREVGRLSNIVSTRTFSTEERVCHLVDRQIKELEQTLHQRTDSAYFSGKLGGKGSVYILDLKGDRQYREEIKQIIPKIDQLLFLLRAKSTLKRENRIAELHQNLQTLYRQNETVLKQHNQHSPATEEKIPKQEKGKKIKESAIPAISTRLPKKADRQDVKRRERSAKREEHRQTKQYIAGNLPVLIQLALDKGGKDLKRNLKARGVNLESHLETDFTKLNSAQLYKVTKRIIFEIYEAHPQNDPAFQVVRDLVAEFDRRLFKEGAYKSPG
ncbi:MAG: hypothetical protein LLG04_13255 [Parachlamydia sp.]|nr:hypothetical protein [Parachlamydia sp.]